MTKDIKISEEKAASPKRESATLEYLNNYTKYSNWHKKVGYLKKETESLGKLGEHPILVISAFLLKCQVIEFELKQLISSLDLEIAINLRFMNSELKRKIRTPNNFEDYTLGKIVSTFCEFDGIVDEQLRRDVTNLNKKRNKFTHHLFSPETDVNQVIEDAKGSLALADKIISGLQKLNEKLNQRFKNEEKTG